MDKSEVLALLRPIIASAQQATLIEYEKAARAAVPPSHNSRSVYAIQRPAVEAADRLVRATWESLEKALDKNRLEWTETTRDDLERLLAQQVQSAAGKLLVPVQPFARQWQLQADHVKGAVHAAVELHLAAAKAQLTFYVANRRRREVIDVLTDLEGRLFELDTQGELLTQVREARQKAQTNSTNDGQLKQVLEVLSQAIPSVVAANDLGVRLVEVMTWIRS